MGIEIDTATITAVLVGEEWLPVRIGTFEIGEYAYVSPEGRMMTRPGDPGFTLVLDRADRTESRVTGPLTSIRAVRRDEGRL